MRYQLECKHCEYVEGNRHIFYGNAKVSREEREFLYLMYNEVFQDSKRPNGCGACQRSVIEGLRKVYEKHCKELCQTKEKEDQETLTGNQESRKTQQADQKEVKTKRTRKSGKRTKS